MCRWREQPPPGTPMSPTAPRTLAPRLWLAAGALLIVHLVAVTLFFGGWLDCSYWQIEILDLDAEESFGTWFAAVILLQAARLLHLQAQAADRLRGWWLVLAAGFCVLSVDEVAGMHEYLNTSLGDTSWTLVGAVGAGLVGVAFLPCLARLERGTRNRFVVAGLAYLGGALGVERSTDGATREELNSLFYNLTTALEEGLEMAGVILFIAALERLSRRSLVESPATRDAA